MRVGKRVVSRQAKLERLLVEAGAEVTHGTLRYPRTKDIIGTQYYRAINDVYRQLGGRLDSFPLRLRRWDMEVDGVAVELDEELHFNRYRSITLEAPVYRDLAAFPTAQYLGFCQEYENRCLAAGSYGRKWTTPPSEVQFGSPSPHGDLFGNGAPRWKQRAFYDFVKDRSPLLIGVRVVRISIWDHIDLGGSHVTIDHALRTENKDAVGPLLKLIEERASCY